MFVLSQQDNALFRGIATLVAIALVLWALGVHMRIAQAANITDVRDVLSDSAPSTVSNHTIEFVSPTGVSAGDTIVITFPTSPDSFNFGSVAEADIDLEVNGVDETLGGGDWTVAISAPTITFTSGAGTIAPGATTTIKIGTNAAGGTNQMTNPSTSNTSYEIDIGGTMTDSGHTRVAIVDSVTVTAQVDTSFDFTVSGFATAGTGVNGTSTTGTTTATTLPFGTLTAGQIETLAQRLNVSTNAINGFVVTAEVDQQLLSSTGADIDAFADATFANPAAWASPSNNVSDEDTWGHWGITSEDSDTTRGAAAEFGSNEWEGASTSPAVVFSHTGPADGTTDGVGSTTVGFQAEITALQEAGDDYSAVLTYIATPTF